MEQAYAQALWKLVEDGVTPHKAVQAIEASLKKAGRGALMSRIARSFERLAQREEGKQGVVLTVAREKDERQARAAAKKDLAALGVEDSGLKTQIDDSIIGGWRLEGRGMLVDNSYKSALKEIYNRVTSA